MTDLKNNIIEKIHTGEVTMRPRWYFVLQGILAIIGFVLLFLVATYLVSFVVFALKQSGLWFTPGFGIRGTIFLFTASPWILIMLAAMFVITLYILVKRYAFSYHRPYLYTFLGIIALTTIGASLIQHTSLHDRIEAFSSQHDVPAISPLYRTLREQRPEALSVGTIATMTPDGFLLTSRERETLTVHTTQKTRVRPGTTIQSGERVLIFGKRTDDTVNALGIRNIDDTQVRERGAGRGDGPSYRKP